MKEFNVSKGFENYSQRNNVITPLDACGPTNFIQALEYAGWQWDNSIFPELNQPEDKLCKFTRTNKDVLAYYEKHYYGMFKNWQNESNKLAKEQGKKYWEVRCIDSYPPNEVHDVMSYAVNLFLGYSPKDLVEKRPVSKFVNKFDEALVVYNIINKLPVVSSVDPFKRGSGHYITIVGFVAEDDFDEKATFNSQLLSKIKEYIIDNTYGKFDFINKKYIAVSGNDEHIERNKFLEIIKPVAHYFNEGAAVCC